MKKTFQERMLITRLDLLIERKMAREFEEEKLINHALYAVKELVEYLEKKDGSDS